MDNKFKKEFLKGSAAAAIGTVSAMLFHFVSIMLLTRNLDKHDFGVYAILLVIVNLFVIVSGFGLNITLVKFITGASETENYASFRAALIIRTAYLILTALLFFISGKYLLPLFNLNDTGLVFFITFIFCIANFRDLFFNLLQGLRMYRKYAVIQVSSAAMRVLFIILLLKFSSISITNLVFVELITAAVTVVILFLNIPLKKMLSFAPTKNTYASLIRFSFPVYLNNLLTFSYDRVSIFLIGALLSPVSVALFDIASKIPEALQRIFYSFTIVFFPSQSKFFGEGNHGAASSLMNKSLNIFSLIIMFGVLIAFLFRDEIIILLFSRAYIEAALPFSLLMLNLYLRILSNIMGYSLVASGNSSAPVKVNSITSIINFVFSIILIPVYGFIGAVYALLIMNTISQVIYHLYIVKSQISSEGLNYLRPLIVLTVLMIPYFLLEDFLLIKYMVIAAYLILNWFYVAEFRNLTAVAAGYILKKRKFSIS